MRNRHSLFQHIVKLCVLSLLLLLGGRAAEAQDVPRFFAEFNDPCRDFAGEGSRRIAAHKDGGNLHIIQFVSAAYTDLFGDDPELYMIRDGAGNVLIDLRGTSWVRMPVVHITDSGVEHLEHVYWLLEPGDNGVLTPGRTAKTGPDGDVSFAADFTIRQLPATDVDAPLQWTVSPTASFRYCVSLGLFRR